MDGLRLSIASQTRNIKLSAYPCVSAIERMVQIADCGMAVIGRTVRAQNISLRLPGACDTLMPALCRS